MRGKGDAGGDAEEGREEVRQGRGEDYSREL